MNFTELLIPYNENGRTISGQVSWLKSKGFNTSLIQEALIKVYRELEYGMVFKDGHDLDRYLLLMVNSLFEDSNILLAKEAEKSFKKLMEKEKNITKRERVLNYIREW